MKRKFINLLLLLSLLTSCSNNDEYVSAGLSIYEGNCTPSVRISIGLKAKRVQEFESTIDVYFGARKSFCKAWKNNEYGCNPGYGTFAINRVIFNNYEDVLSESYTMLYDFPNENKYIMSEEVFEGKIYRYRYNYTDFITFTYDFSLLEIDEGIIGYFICYYDDINNKEFDDVAVYRYGINRREAFRFKKNNENKTVTFSKY